MGDKSRESVESILSIGACVYHSRFYNKSCELGSDEISVKFVSPTLVGLRLIAEMPTAILVTLAPARFALTTSGPCMMEILYNLEKNGYYRSKETGLIGTSGGLRQNLFGLPEPTPRNCETTVQHICLNYATLINNFPLVLPPVRSCCAF